MDEAAIASDRVLIKASRDKQVPWTSILFCSIIVASHTLVLVGNMETAAAFHEIGVSTAGWSGVGIQLADSLSNELEDVLKTVAHMLTVAIGRIMEVQDMIDLITGFQSKSIDVVMSSRSAQALLLLEAHGIMDSRRVDGVAGMIAKSMTTSVDRMTGTIKDAIKSLLDKLKPALIQVGKFIIKFGEKVQAIIQSFSVTLDRVQKVFDQIMASMSKPGANEPLMMHQTFHMFDAMNTGVVTATGLHDVAKLYDVPALQGVKADKLILKYDTDKSGDLDHKEFTNLIHGGDIPNLLSVVLRSFAKSLAKVAGQVGGSKFRGEIANDVCDYLELMTAKNHTKVDWISDHLGNGSLPLPFVSGVLISLALKVDDPNTHKTVPTGAYVVNQMMKLHPNGFAKAMDQAANASFYESQGYSPDLHKTVVKRLTGWSTQKDPYADLDGGSKTGGSKTGGSNGSSDSSNSSSFAQIPDASELLQNEAKIGADGTINVEGSTMQIDRKLVETMQDLAYKVAEENMNNHLREIEEERQRLSDEFLSSDTAQYLVMHLMGGQLASKKSKSSSNPAVAATRTQIPALPATLQFAKWLSWNATHTAKLFNEWSFKYQKTSSNAIDSFATQVQSMVKKIQGFIKMMMKYSTPDGIDNLENILIDYAEAQLEAMLYVTKKRVGHIIEQDGFEALSTPDMDIVERIDRALEGPLGNGLAPGVAEQLLQARDAKDLSATQLHKEITNLYADLAETSMSTVSKALDGRVKASLIHIEVSNDIKKLHEEGLGTVDDGLIANIEKDVTIAVKQAQDSSLLQTDSVPGAVAGATAEAAGDIAETLTELVEDAIMLLHALTHALPQASKALIFAKKEVSMLSKTLDNIFKVFEVKGPEILDEVDYYYAYVWRMYYFLMLTMPAALLFYAFWAGGFFGGPGTKVDEPRVRRPNALAKLCGCLEDCCRCICWAHECQGYGGAEMCFWSVCLFLQFLVLLLFIMAILITIIAAIQFFLASGCAQIYLLGDQSICGHVLSNLKMFLGSMFPGVADYPNHCINKNLLTCELIGKKMRTAAEYTVIGSFMAAVFTFQMIVESGQLHSRALSRIRFEHEWKERHPVQESRKVRRKLQEQS